MTSVVQLPRQRELLREQEPASPPGDAALLAFELTLLVVIAAVVRAVLLDRPVFVDEVNHLLAARSFLSQGTLEITDGGTSYTRARIFTYLVAGMSRLLGESLVVARLPAMLAGVGVVILLFVWLRSVAGRGAAWIGALLLALDPWGIYLSQLVRFYSLHALVFLAGAVAFYAVLTPRAFSLRRMAVLGGLAAAFFLLAVHLHRATVIGLSGVGVAAALLGGPGVYRSWAASRHRAWWLILALALLAMIAYVLPYTWLIGGFQGADWWAEPDRYNIRFYHRYFLDTYPTLWTLLPILAIVAFVRFPKPAVYCAAIFGVSIILHSLAAWKTQRFIFYTLPFLFALVGMGSVDAVRWIFGNLRGFLGDANLPLRPRAVTAVAIGVLAVALGVAARSNHGFVLTQRMVVAKDGDIPYALPDWSAAAPTLRALAEDAEVVLTSDELKALYFVGRVDYDITPEYLSQLRGSRTEPVSPKSNSLWVITPQALRLAMECHGSGLVLTEEWQWGTPRPPAGVPVELSEAILELTDPVRLPPEWRLRVFRWRNPEARWSADCLDMRDLNPVPRRDGVLP